MNSTTNFETALQPLTEIIDSVPADAWDNPSPCEGWTARDVLRHLIDTQRDFLTGHGVDLGPTPDVTADPVVGWHEHVSAVGERLADPAVAGASFDGHFGPTTIGATMDAFYGFDLVVHRWDIARAAGLPTAFSTDELDRLEAAIAGFGDALYGDGICQPPVDTPPDADRPTRVLALLGRDAAA